MKLKKYFLLNIMFYLLFSFTSCQEDEKLNLKSFPINKPSITISDTDGESEVIINGKYNSEGVLELDGKVSRTYNFTFLASPEEATVYFEVIATDIPNELIEIDTQKEVLPPGYTDVQVTVTLKDEDFSFAQSNYEATTYELGVKAIIEGYSTDSTPFESKVIINKEAYTSQGSIITNNENSTVYERGYNNGEIVNKEPIIHIFNVHLDKPALHDTKIKIKTSGLEDQFLSDVSVTPKEILIPAGETQSEEISWTITNDFLLQTNKEETHILTLTLESEDDAFEFNKEGNLVLIINKVLKNMQLVSEALPTWSSLDKKGWSVETDPDFNGSGNNLIDGNGGIRGSDLYAYNELLWFVVDMQSEKTINGIGIDYYGASWSKQFYGSKKVQILTSTDKINWISAGTLDTPEKENNYFRFFSSVNARYIKVLLTERLYSYIDITEVYVYE